MEEDILKYIFMTSDAKSTIHKAVLEHKFLTEADVNAMLKALGSPQGQSIMRLLTMMNDRTPKGGERPEDAYARFPRDLATFLSQCKRSLNAEKNDDDPLKEVSRAKKKAKNK